MWLFPEKELNILLKAVASEKVPKAIADADGTGGKLLRTSWRVINQTSVLGCVHRVSRRLK